MKRNHALVNLPKHREGARVHKYGEDISKDRGCDNQWQNQQLR